MNTGVDEKLKGRLEQLEQSAFSKDVTTSAGGGGGAGGGATVKAFRMLGGLVNFASFFSASRTSI